jgi:poly(hydroxyalkanoate) depolymerase family esterase
MRPLSIASLRDLLAANAKLGARLGTKLGTKLGAGLGGLAPDPAAILDRVLRGRGAPPDRAAPAAVPGVGQFLDEHFTNAAGSRPYKVYVPSPYHGQALPLVVMLHGCTQSPDDFAAGTRMNEAAEAQGCFVVYPGQIEAANASRCWNWFNAAEQERERGEPSLIAGITHAVMARYGIDPARVYVGGLSAGGALAATMGHAYPELYAAVGVHSGLASGAASDVPSAFAAMRAGHAGRAADGRNAPTIVFHGDRDSTVHPRNAEAVIAQFRPAGPLDARVEQGQVPGGHAYTRTRYADASGRVALESWLIHGGGHAWSGGSAAGSYTDPHGPDASGVMLRFFLDHPQDAIPRAG